MAADGIYLLKGWNLEAPKLCYHRSIWFDCLSNWIWLTAVTQKPDSIFQKKFVPNNATTCHLCDIFSLTIL